MQKTNKFFIITFIVALTLSLLNINSTYACVGGNKPPKGVVVKCGYITPEEAQPHNSDEDYVGSDMELKEGEVGITSIEEPKILRGGGEIHEEQAISNFSEQPQILREKVEAKETIEVKKEIENPYGVERGMYVDPNEDRNKALRLLIPIATSSIMVIIATYFYFKRNKKD